jgi:hypothetical protein
MPPQALLKRNPNFTVEEFSDAWLDHAKLVVPLFLWCGVEFYVQVLLVPYLPAFPLPLLLPLPFPYFPSPFSFTTKSNFQDTRTLNPK